MVGIWPKFVFCFKTCNKLGPGGFSLALGPHKNGIIRLLTNINILNYPFVGLRGPFSNHTVVDAMCEVK